MKRLFSLVITVVFFLTSALPAYAIVDPLSVSNNKFGIHILFDSELQEAAKLVNSNGGDWGYVTIPIQAKDRDPIKWQKFFDEAQRLHIIPIVRLATENYYFNSKVWRTPTHADIIDFANFLDSLNWPTKNRYIIVFNEVNRGDEWGSTTNPAEYAEILHFTISEFKKRSPDFFMISAGLDNAAPQEPPNYMNQYTYMREMHDADPAVFSLIDGFSSHSYPNPGFSQPPSVHNTKSIASFTYERNLLKSFSGKDLPVFITETGWTSENITDEQRAEYYKTALASIWADKGIVAITPFLLNAGGMFGQFSFLKDDGQGSKQYEAIQQMPKVKGEPPVIQINPNAEIRNVLPPVETRTYVYGSMYEKDPGIYSTKTVLTNVFTWIFKI